MKHSLLLQSTRICTNSNWCCKPLCYGEQSLCCTVLTENWPTIQYL